VASVARVGERLVQPSHERRGFDIRR
jgi:hypothetical protein